MGKRDMARRALKNLLCTAGCLILAAHAFAEDTGEKKASPSIAATAPKKADTAAATQLGALMVTAEKHVESVQKTPVSIDAFNADQLKAMGMSKPSDLVSQVPNASFQSMFGASQNPSFCFRSICLNSQYGDGFEPPVALYTDGVYTSSAFAQSLAMFDIARIEVLKGPQGTLYGRNATGGLFNIVTNKPTDYLESSVTADYGSYQNRQLDAVISGPLAKGVTGRLAVETHKRDGWERGVVDNGVKANDINTKAVRGMLNFDLPGNGTLLLSANYFNVDQGGQGYGLNGTLNPKTGGGCSLSQMSSGSCVGIFGDDSTSAKDLYGKFSPRHWYGADIAGGLRPKNYINSYGTSATLNWDVDDIDINSVTSFSAGNKKVTEDLDGAINDGYDDQLWAKAKTLSEDFHLSGLWGSADWIAGAFMYKDMRALRTELTPASDYADRSTKDTSSAAVYGNLGIPFTDQLKLVLGGRYTWEKKDVHFSRSGDYATTVDDAQRDLSNVYADGKAVLQWTPSNDIMAYGSITTGHRGGDVNSQSQYGIVEKGSPLDSLKPVKPEFLMSYELGVKADFADHRMRINASIFDYVYKNMQTSVLVTYCGLGADDACSSAGRMRNLKKVIVTGGEIELSAQPLRGLTIDLGLAYTKSRINTNQLDDDGEPLNGHELPMSNPSANARINYVLPLNGQGRLNLGVDTHWVDNHNFSISNSVITESPSYSVTNAHVSWFSMDSRYQVELYANNIFNKKYYIFAQDLYETTQSVVWGDPRMFGMRFTWNY